MANGIIMVGATPSRSAAGLERRRRTPPGPGPRRAASRSGRRSRRGRAGRRARVLDARAPLPERLHEVPDLARGGGERAGQGAAHRPELGQEPPGPGGRAEERRADQARRSCPPRSSWARRPGRAASPEAPADVVRAGIADPDDQEQHQHGARRDGRAGSTSPSPGSAIATTPKTVDAAPRERRRRRRRASRAARRREQKPTASAATNQTGERAWPPRSTTSARRSRTGTAPTAAPRRPAPAPTAARPTVFATGCPRLLGDPVELPERRRAPRPRRAALKSDRRARGRGSRGRSGSRPPPASSRFMGRT